MTEQKIEKIVLDKMKAALEAAEIENIQLIGVWQSVADGELKGFEEAQASGILGVKVYPRIYETPTVPDGSFQVDVALTIRAEVDSTGKGYMEATSVVAQVLHDWQKSYNNYAADFSIENEFQPTGFNLESGDVGLNKEDCVWQYSCSFNIYGIIS